jgi:hypothetical protein
VNGSPRGGGGVLVQIRQEPLLNISIQKKLTQIISLDAIDDVREKRRDILKETISCFSSSSLFSAKNSSHIEMSNIGHPVKFKMTSQYFPHFFRNFAAKNVVFFTNFPVLISGATA